MTLDKLHSKPFCRNTMTLPKTVLESKRLLLRPFRPSDIDVFFEMESDPDVMAFIPLEYRDDVSDKQKHRALIMDRAQNTNRFKFFYVVVQKKTNDPLGWVFLRPTEDQKWMELGYRLAKRAWGKEYMPEACCALFDMAFKEWNLSEVMALIDKENDKSIRVIEKLNFSFDCVANYYDDDLNLYVLTRETWATNQG